MNGAAPGSSRSMTPMPALDRKRDREDGRGRRVDDREEGADGMTSGEGAHGWGLDLWCVAASRVSRCGHTVPPRRLPASSTGGLDRTGPRRAFAGGPAIPRYRSGPSQRRMRRHPARSLPFAATHGHSLARGRRAALLALTPTRRRHGDRRRPLRAVAAGLRGRRAVRRRRSAGSLTVFLLLLESLPLIVRRRYPLVGPDRGQRATDRPDRAAAGGGGPAMRDSASSSRSTPSASASIDGCRSADGAHRRPRRRSCSSAARASSEVALSAHPDRAHLRRRLAARRRDADPPPVRGGARGAGAAARARARGAGRAGDPRGTRADRARAPRRGHAPRERDGDPGRRRQRVPSRSDPTRPGRRSRRSRRPAGWR